MELKHIGLAVIALVLLAAAPVSAADVVVHGSISPAFAFTCGSDAVNFPMPIVGVNDLTTTNIVHVTTNQGYTVSVKGVTPPYTDAALLPAGSEGYLKTVISGNRYSGARLTNPLQVSVNTAYVTLTGTDQIAHTGTAGDYSAPLKLRQTTTFNDPVLPAGWTYDATVVITGAATP